MATSCPRCGEALVEGARVCRHCLFIVDRAGWQHDAGRLGGDGRGGERRETDARPPPGPWAEAGFGGFDS